MTRSRSRNRRTRGMAMVEMIFVVPLLILILFAIAEFGLMFSRWLTLSNAVREGARVGVTYRGTDAQCAAANPSVENQVRNAINMYAQAGGIDPAVLTVNVNGQCVQGQQLVVNASYQFRLNIPFARIPPIPLAYSSAMRNEGTIQN